eukprot:1291016-Alexandrium_andersonii.AAC.1
MRMRGCRGCAPAASWTARQWPPPSPARARSLAAYRSASGGGSPPRPPPLRPFLPRLPPPSAP